MATSGGKGRTSGSSRSSGVGWCLSGMGAKVTCEPRLVRPAHGVRRVPEVQLGHVAGEGGRPRRDGACRQSTA